MPLDWRDIEAWKAATGETLLAWEARLLRQMSAVYAGELANDDPDRIMPWQAWLKSAENRDTFDRKAKSIMSRRVTHVYRGGKLVEANPVGGGRRRRRRRPAQPLQAQPGG